VSAPDDASREALRRTFGSVAERYDRARPGYPEATVDDLVALAGLSRGAPVLEIGCGTGQLTVPMARRGLAVTAVELSPELAEVARGNLAAVPAAPGVAPPVVEVGAFEDWSPVGTQRFDLVVAATSFHWVDPAVRVPRAVGLLRPGGSLAVIGTEHVASDDEFFDLAQDCYVRWDPDVTEPAPMSPASAVPEAVAELDDSPLLGPVTLRRYEWDATYTAAAYIELLLTYSGHLALPAAARDGLLGCLTDLIEGRGGRVTKGYLTELRIARRADQPPA
jgi:SAM-dependent methyltransferase